MQKEVSMELEAAARKISPVVDRYYQFFLIPGFPTVKLGLHYSPGITTNRKVIDHKFSYSFGGTKAASVQNGGIYNLRST